MADQKGGGITWTDQTWNCVRGCSVVSAGCKNCYAAAVASRFSGPGLPYEGLAKDGKWTGKVRLVPEHLADPLRWTKPRRIFVNSMSDLFHEGLSDKEIAAVFGVMASAPQHTFQVLTKRPQRMLDWFRWLDSFHDPEIKDDMRHARCWAYALNYGITDKAGPRASFPLKNVWLGVSVEDQKTADERIPLLLQTPAAVRFVSYEPALGPVNFRTTASVPHPPYGLRSTNALAETSGLHWIIIGGESGPHARPFDVAWARSVVEDCSRSTVKCFVKQLGERPIQHTPDHPGCFSCRDVQLKLNDRKGGDMAEWPEDLRIREFPR